MRRFRSAGLPGTPHTAPGAALVLTVAATVACPAAAMAQGGEARAAPPATPATPGTPADSLATLRVRVREAAPDAAAGAPGAPAAPIAGAVVRSGRAGALTDPAGVAVLRLAAGAHQVVTARLGFRPDTLTLALRAGQDTTVAVALTPLGAALTGVVVTATRSNRRVEDEPTRVEVVAPEEVEEKTAMQPASVAMLLNETSGVRVQPTAPGLGGASLRIQGLRGRYTQVLADGLPLYGTTTEGIGLLQIPPLDLDHAEVIKGVASALYGGSALGGVVNLASRRPTAGTREALVNHTSRGGTDAVAFVSDSLSARWGGGALGYTLLAGLHRQTVRDLDGDAWADLAAYDRAVVRPRLVWTGAGGASLLATVGATVENRAGGTLPGQGLPGQALPGTGLTPAVPFALDLRTRRYDAGLVGRMPLGPRAWVHVRASGTAQDQAHAFGPTRERDRLRTAFGEASLTGVAGPHTLVAGVALQADRYRNAAAPGVDFAFTTPGLFAQDTYAPSEALAVTASARVDRHSAYGTVASPRLSVLVRPSGLLAGWTARASAGGGFFAPTPFTEETAPIGRAVLAPVRYGGPGGLRAERARSASADVGRTVATAFGALELNVTGFLSVIDHALALREVPDASGRLPLVTLGGPTRTAGGEAYARLRTGPVTLVGTYAFLRATEADPDAPDAGAGSVRRVVPLNARHCAGLNAIYEREARGTKVGVEAYYTGRQALADDPYRAESRPYVVAGLFAQQRVATPFGTATLFVNGENLGNVRQTRVDPLLRPTAGPGGRLTTDVWAPLEGRVVNAGVRIGFGRRAEGAEGAEDGQEAR